MLAGSARQPSNLFSHSDQIVAMQAGDANGSGGTGWAGRSADAVLARNGGSRFPASLSMNGSALLCTGVAVTSASLVPGFDLTADGMGAWPDRAMAAKSKALAEILTMADGLAVVQAANQVRQDALSLNRLPKSRTGGTLATALAGTPLGQQLQQVARITKLRATAGMARQAFFSSIGGFDTPSAQSWTR